jgi:hypothetical protein
MLPVRIENAWKNVKRIYSEKSENQLFDDFKKRWNHFKGPEIEEFLSVNESVYREWHLLYYNNVEFSFTKAWDEFKSIWQLETNGTKLMFEEMEKIKMSNNMHCEWTMKYNFDYPHVYENDVHYELKSKAQLWEEFKEIWEIDINDYNEYKYFRMNEYVNDIQCEDGDDFFLYCEDSNYHSFDSYSLLEQFEICEHYDSIRVTPKNRIINEMEIDTDADTNIYRKKRTYCLAFEN